MNDTPDWWTNWPRSISVVIDNDSWVLPFGESLVSASNEAGDNAILCRDHADVAKDGIAFYLGCLKITPPNMLARNHRNLIVHESDLPKGGGFSPMTWQILEGRNDIPVCLFEAVEEADSGPIIYRECMKFQGHELIDEMRQRLGDLTVELCLRFLNEPVAPLGTPQSGEPTRYRRRRPKDSRLDPALSIVEQFNLLRVVDNKKYPAFVDICGRRYKLLIEEVGEIEPDNDEIKDRHT